MQTRQYQSFNWYVMEHNYYCGFTRLSSG